jgi:uncharacterized membrane protein
VVWVVYLAGLLAAGFGLRLRPVRYLALGFSAAFLSKLVLFDIVYKPNYFAYLIGVDFALAIVWGIALLMAAILLRRFFLPEDPDATAWKALAMGTVFVLWILLTEYVYLYWYGRNPDDSLYPDWRYHAQMYVSILWAVYAGVLMIVGFVLQIRSLRYMALGLFALLLGKIFLIDMRQVRSVYRMAAFLATGLTLVGVSYLYQFAKKKGLFDIPSTDGPQPDPSDKKAKH